MADVLTVTVGKCTKDLFEYVGGSLLVEELGGSDPVEKLTT